MLPVNFHTNGVLRSQQDLKNLTYNLFGFTPVMVSRLCRLFQSLHTEISTYNSDLTLEQLTNLGKGLQSTHYTISLLFVENEDKDHYLMKINHYFSDSERDNIYSQLF